MRFQCVFKVFIISYLHHNSDGYAMSTWKLCRHSAALVAILFLSALFSLQARADLTDKAFKGAVVGAGVVGAGIYIQDKLSCKYGHAEDVITDPLTGEQKVKRRCLAPNGGLVWKDYNLVELGVILSTTKELRKRMAAEGEVAKKGCAAHHIVPKKDSKFEGNDESRDILQLCNIDIDDAINGVYLPHNSDAQCKGSKHRSLHTKEYYKAIHKLLTEASDRGCDDVVDVMKKIKKDLVNENLGSSGYVN